MSSNLQHLSTHIFILLLDGFRWRGSHYFSILALASFVGLSPRHSGTRCTHHSCERTDHTVPSVWAAEKGVRGSSLIFSASSTGFIGSVKGCRGADLDWFFLLACFLFYLTTSCPTSWAGRHRLHLPDTLLLSSCRGRDGSHSQPVV